MFQRKRDDNNVGSFTRLERGKLTLPVGRFGALRLNVGLVDCADLDDSFHGLLLARWLVLVVFTVLVASRSAYLVAAFV